MLNNVTFGTDFEMGVCTRFWRKVVPVTGKLGGTKDYPKDIGNQCFCQEDNTMAEFNIPPVRYRDDWNGYIDYCIEKGNQILSFNNLMLKPMTSYTYKGQDLDNLELRELGCEPSWDAYTGELRFPDGNLTNMRTCGFHVHFGFPNNQFNFDNACRLAKICDLHLGIPSVLLDGDKNRRKLYGKAGDFRTKEIFEKGLMIFEYRSLSGYFLKTQKLRSWVFDQLRTIVDVFNSGDKLPSDLELEKTINSSDRKQAEKFVRTYNLRVA